MILEWSEEVRLGMIRFSSLRLVGLDSPERGREVKEGAIGLTVAFLNPSTFD